MKIGILGAGQLGQMIALEGYKLGHRFKFWDPSPASCASQLGEFVCAPYSDKDALNQFLSELDIVTYEFENIPVELLESIEQRVLVAPNPEILRRSQDRLLEKQFLKSLGLDTAPFYSTDRNALDDAINAIGLPSILKTRRFGYDGKGQFRLKTMADVESARKSMGNEEYVLEGHVSFGRELSLVGARSVNGNTAFYPLIENEHSKGILRRSVCPAPDLSTELQNTAESMARKIMTAVSYTGVMTVELFDTTNGLVINEIAPRVHNSGHWTLGGAAVSQFELHVRAITGSILGNVQSQPLSMMRNLVGVLPDASDIVSLPAASLQIYGKALKPGRKVGHITVTGCEPSIVRSSFASIDDTISRLELSVQGE